MLLAVALLSSAAFLQGCGGGGDSSTTTTTTPNSGTTIPDIAGKTADLSTLVEALKAAGLVSTLAGPGPFTVFAPTNDAFNALPFNGSELTYLLNNKDKLTEVLEYHVASGNVTSGDLKNGEKIKMLAGGNVTVTITNTTVMINDATVTTADVMASNGVVHIINKVLIPADFTAPNIPELATAANLTTLVTAVTAADLGAALSGGPLTVFAPTNAAFAALPDGVLTALLKPENKESLQQVLKYHVHSGEVTAGDIKSGEQQIDTLEGSKLNITKTDSNVQVNTANVTSADNFAINGVVHVINGVLLPPGFVPPTSKIAKIVV
jgi:transforming growth factor-beta-induced protein